MQLDLIITKAYFYIYYPVYKGSNSFIICLIYYYKIFNIKHFNRFIGARTIFNLGFIKVINLKLKV